MHIFSDNIISSFEQRGHGFSSFCKLFKILMTFSIVTLAIQIYYSRAPLDYFPVG